MAIQQTLVQDINLQLKAAEEALRDIEVRLNEVKNPRLIQKYDEQYTACENDILRLKTELKNTHVLMTKAAQRRTYTQLIKEVGDSWEDIVLPEEVPIMVGFFVDRVALTPFAPRFYRVTIHWSDPEWGIEDFLFVRSHGPGTYLTAEEKKIIREHYPYMPRKELLGLLPDRTWMSILVLAQGLGVSREIKESSDFPKDICWHDLLAMQQYDVSKESFDNGAFYPQKFCSLVGSGHNQLASHCFQSRRGDCQCRATRIPADLPSAWSG